MKLYYSPGVCSLSPHIVLCELGIKHQIEKVDLKSKKTETGNDYNNIAEKGSVPMLVLDNGEQLTEGVAIVQYLADLKPEANLAPMNGTLQRARLYEILNYISTEVHKNFSPLFAGEQVGEKAVAFYVEKLKKSFSYLAEKLKGNKYLMGDQFTVADAYLFTVLGWHKVANLDLAQWPALLEYHTRVSARPAVQQAMGAEGILQNKAA